MSEQLRMLLVFALSFILMIVSINLSTYSKQSKFLKEDLEVAVHDASLKIDKVSLSNGYIVFDKEAALATFKETLEINTGLTEDDYTVTAFEYFDHETHSEGFACEDNTNPIYEYVYESQTFKITCPTIIAIIAYDSNKYITMPGQSADGKTIIKGAAYSYEYRSNVHLAGIAGLSASLMANEYELESMILASDLIKKGDYYWPVPYTTNITSHFQKNRLHPITGEIRDHNGVDIAIQGVENKQAVSITDGIVTFAGWIDGYGNVVEVMHENNLTTRYAHLNKLLVSKGDLVSGGDVVGLIGSTGNSTNPHLHFEALVDGTFINPLTLFE